MVWKHSGNYFCTTAVVYKQSLSTFHYQNTSLLYIFYLITVHVLSHQIFHLISFWLYLAFMNSMATLRKIWPKHDGCPKKRGAMNEGGRSWDVADSFHPPCQKTLANRGKGQMEKERRAGERHYKYINDLNPISKEKRRGAEKLIETLS